VFENRVSRRIFGSKRDEVTGGWRILLLRCVITLHFMRSIVRMIKSLRMGLAGHVARMGGGGGVGEEAECVYDIGWNATRE
jgi:hypothetical protein